MTQATRSLDNLELRTSKYNQICANMLFLVKQDLDGSCLLGTYAHILETYVNNL